MHRGSSRGSLRYSQGLPDNFYGRGAYNFKLLMFSRIRPKNDVVVSRLVGAALGSESFLLPGEAWVPGHTGV